MPESCKKLNIILDIDETLVYFIHNRYRKHSWDALPDNEKGKYEIQETKNGLFVIRPHLREFLDFLFANCTVSLWTWSDEDYAESIATRFLGYPERPVALLLSEVQADESSWKHGNNKDLNWIWYDLKKPCFAECNTILIDDLPTNSVNSSNRKNSITVAPFALFGEIKDRTDPYTDVSDDRCLLDIIDILKTVLDSKESCYGTDLQWENVFSPKNIAAMGLQRFHQRILLKQRNKPAEIVQGMGVGNSHFFQSQAGGVRRRKRYTKKQKSRRTKTHRSKTRRSKN